MADQGGSLKYLVAGLIYREMKQSRFAGRGRLPAPVFYSAVECTRRLGCGAVWGESWLLVLGQHFHCSERIGTDCSRRLGLRLGLSKPPCRTTPRLSWHCSEVRARIRVCCTCFARFTLWLHTMILLLHQSICQGGVTCSRMPYRNKANSSVLVSLQLAQISHPVSSAIIDLVCDLEADWTLDNWNSRLHACLEQV